MKNEGQTHVAIQFFMRCSPWSYFFQASVCLFMPATFINRFPKNATGRRRAQGEIGDWPSDTSLPSLASLASPYRFRSIPQRWLRTTWRMRAVLDWVVTAGWLHFSPSSQKPPTPPTILLLACLASCWPHNFINQSTKPHRAFWWPYYLSARSRHCRSKAMLNI